LLLGVDLQINLPSTAPSNEFTGNSGIWRRRIIRDSAVQAIQALERISISGVAGLTSKQDAYRAMLAALLSARTFDFSSRNGQLLVYSPRCFSCHNYAQT